MGHFVLKTKTKLSEMKLEDKLDESDYAFSEGGEFFQFEYKEKDETKLNPYPVHPGVYAIGIKNQQFCLYETSFVKDNLLESLVASNTFGSKINLFFERLHVYKKHGIEVPKRAALLWGPAGSGKSSSISKAVRSYGEDKKTCVVVWHTDKYEAYKVKDFIKRFDYTNVERIILIAEDIGGVELEEQRIPSESSLLSLLDNNEKTFTIPVFIIATTNHPEVFLANLTNRPGRFDDKIEVGYLTEDQRVDLLKFFSKDTADEATLNAIRSTKFDKFTPAHIRETIIRADLYDKELKTTLLDMAEEIETYEKAFSKKGRMGIM